MGISHSGEPEAAERSLEKALPNHGKVCSGFWDDPWNLNRIIPAQGE